MGLEEEGWGGWPPAPSDAPLYIPKDEHWTHFDNSVNAVSFGFIATAILISMFLVMAIFEKLLRTTSPALSPSVGRRRNSDIEAQNHVSGINVKLGYLSPKAEPENTLAHNILEMGHSRLSWSIAPLVPTSINKEVKVSNNAREVSVMMPGNNVPTFIASPAPVACPPDRMPWPPHQHRSNIHAPPTST